MSARLLTSKPVSGSVEERHYSASAAENTRVQFDDDDGNEWMGVFVNLLAMPIVSRPCCPVACRFIGLARVRLLVQTTSRRHVGKRAKDWSSQDSVDTLLV